MRCGWFGWWNGWQWVQADESDVAALQIEHSYLPVFGDQVHREVELQQLLVELPLAQELQPLLHIHQVVALVVPDAARLDRDAVDDVVVHGPHHVGHRLDIEDVEEGVNRLFESVFISLYGVHLWCHLQVNKRICNGRFEFQCALLVSSKSEEHFCCARNHNILMNHKILEQ